MRRRAQRERARWATPCRAGGTAPLWSPPSRVPLLPQDGCGSRLGDDRRQRLGPARRSPCCRSARAPATSPSSRCRCGPSRWSTVPYDDPERLRPPPAPPTRSSADRADRLRPAAQRPPAAVARPACPSSSALDRFLTWAHWLWFFEPYMALISILSATTSASRGRRGRWPPSSTSAAPATSPCRPRRPGGPPSRARPARRRCAGSWSRSARTPGAAPGRGCTRRSAATPGRRCPRCTSRPR